MKLTNPKHYRDRSQSNPLYSAPTSILVAVINGEIDPVALAAEELNARCRDHYGNHVGMKASETIYRAFMRSRGGKAA